MQQQIKADNLDRAIPTIDVIRKGDNVEIDFGDFKRVFGHELAQAFATTLYLFATPKTPNGYAAFDRENADALNQLSQELRDFNLAMSGAEQHVGVSRRGTSIKIVGEGGRGERTLAPSIARELADIVRAVATA
ncbi:hypothetical protein GGR20_003204 [Devosia subaequoris]|uniref:Uncharacterized protein n=1 Tax=Devosia subaequoris TaxID=395930 RepID=A0A7W6IQQ2_9HYPH|nr:hypothetical protein [Devosia subaequoris]MBB4053542.1 hypothetical protein [Devosia subaequoris]MCP1211280.1 hypothetical protein [Devosia subaequoris]